MKIPYFAAHKNSLGIELPVACGFELPRLIILNGGSLEARRGQPLDRLHLLVRQEVMVQDKARLQENLLLLHWP
jgi:hypothetical protein